MKNILGIIAEYNPLHNGHIYHIKRSKEITKSECTVAVISGNFTQRGEPSIVNKWDKTKIALDSGEIDLVIELPTLYSISSAENFARGGVTILNELGLVDYISFGVEGQDNKEDDIEDLKKIATILYNETEEYKEYLKEELQKGKSYPKARERAIIRYTGDENHSNILSGSNNILGIEYLKTLLELKEEGKLKRDIVPIAIKRQKVKHNSFDIFENYASGAEIRNLFSQENLEEIKNLVPKSSWDVLMENFERGTYIINSNEHKSITSLKNFEREIIYKLRIMTVKEIKRLPEVNEGLENLIKEMANKTNNIDELISGIKSKRYTQTRIQRILLYALLGITKEDMDMSKKTVPYIRVLGFNQNGKNLLSKIDSSNIITSVKKFEDNCTNNMYKRMLEIDKLSTDIYTIGYKKNSNGNLDYKTRNYIS